MTEKEFYVWIGKRLRALREKANLKQKDVAEKICIRAQFISDVENRGKKISAYQLNRILLVMGYTQADLVPEDTQKKNLPLLSMVMS